MKATLRKVLTPVAVIWIIALLIAGFLAYFVTSAGPHGLADGFGRPLTEAPLLMRLIFGQERLWAGFGWFFGDMLILWGSIAVISLTAKRLED
jgi:hypothetical protein